MKEFSEFNVILCTFLGIAGSGSTYIAVLVPGLHFLGLLVTQLSGIGGFICVTMPDCCRTMNMLEQPDLEFPVHRLDDNGD